MSALLSAGRPVVGGASTSSGLMWLVLLETSGNQAYIFDTSRRRENVGASHLIASLGDWTLDALVRLGLAAAGTVRAARVPTDPAEVLTTAAGRVQVLVTDPERGRALVAAVTSHALVHAPGLDVCGVVVPFDWTDAGNGAAGTTGRTLPGAAREASGLLARVRAARPAQPSARFPRLPIAEHCRSSPLPAAGLYDVVDRDTLRAAAEADLLDELPEPEPRSAFSRAKLRAVDGARTAAETGGVESAYDRLATLLLAPPPENPEADMWTPGAVPAAQRAAARRELEITADHLQSDREWVAVVHADGNGLGEVFLGLGAEIADRPARVCAEILRDFSAAVEAATLDAYLAAVDELVRLGRVRPEPSRHDAEPGESRHRFNAEVLPLILGGDDLTVICEGTVALTFTAAYLRSLEERTLLRLRAVVDEHQLREERAVKLTAKAGVAIVKRSYPFSSAYHLAEALMDDEARLVKTLTPGASGLAFHVLYDTAAADLDTLRGRATADDGAWLHAQPYVVTAPPEGWGGWAARHRWASLLAQVAALQRPADGREGRALPRSQTHDLRGSLQLGREVADARYRGLRAAAGTHRYPGLDTLAAPGGTATLFWDDDEDPDESRWVTRYLDAMDAEAFLADAAQLHGEAVARGEDPR